MSVKGGKFLGGCIGKSSKSSSPRRFIVCEIQKKYGQPNGVVKQCFVTPQNIVAVLLSCFTHDVEHVEVGKRGREIALYAKINDYRFTFIKTQVKFFESLKLRIRKFADENIIIGGNLNCCLTRKDKKRGRPTEQKKQLIDSILSLTNSINLVDLWRKFHPNESLFTWHHQSSAIQCRVDYWLVSKHLLLHVKECNIIPVSFSEHSAVSFNIQSDDFIKRGPGFFQFNKSIP